ncbi:MAG: hypothetical protein GKR89_29525 [Candidatus Latescibacteria bacterium]|nr:hypothetical protein [Candidatus Latescibacterota bacterium]
MLCCIRLLLALAVLSALPTAGLARPVIMDLAVTVPDSGVLLGIDSLFTVQVDIAEVNAPDDLQVFFWLVQGGAEATPDQIIPDATQIDSVTTANGQRFALDAALATKLAFPAAAPSLVAATQILGAGRQGFPAFDPLDPAFDSLEERPFGDADTVLVEVLPTLDTYRFTWIGRISASTSVHNGVRAAVMVRSHQLDSAIALSSPEAGFTVDGDRPGHYGIRLNRADLAFKGGLVRDLVLFPAWPNQRRFIGGIGDTLALDIDLSGGQENMLLFTDAVAFRVLAFGHTFPLDRSNRTSTVLHLRVPLVANGGFGNFDPTIEDSNRLIVFTVDPAGNLGSDRYAGTEGGVDDPDRVSPLEDDAVPTGIWADVAFLVDDIAPLLDEATGDTLLPASGDTLGDGTVFAEADFAASGSSERSPATAPPADDGFRHGAERPLNLLGWRLSEVLGQLEITFSQGGANKARVTVAPDPSNLGLLTTELARDQWRWLDFTDISAAAPGARITETGVHFATDGRRLVLKTKDGDDLDSKVDFVFLSGTDSLASGRYDITFKGTDLAGNPSPARKHSDIYLDLEPLSFGRYFPTNEALGDQLDRGRPDTINQETAVAVFKMDQAADSLAVIYTPLGLAPGSSDEIVFPLSGAQLSDLSRQKIDGFIDLLVPGNTYDMTLVARDKAGHFTKVGPERLHFIKTAPPALSHFTLSVSRTLGDARHQVDGLGQLGLDPEDHLLAGQNAVIDIRAYSGPGRRLTTYRADVLMEVTGGTGVTLSGDGVSRQDQTTWLLPKDYWTAGQFAVTLRDTAAGDILGLKVREAASLAAGILDSTIAYAPVEPEPEPLPKSDFNGDSTVDFEDFFIFAQHFTAQDLRGDLDASGRVDLNDLFLFADQFGQKASP